MDRLAVFTNVIGGQYDLPDIVPSESVDYFCFSDQKEVDEKGWTVIPVELILPGDAFRSSRDFKIRPHRFLKSHTRSIYIDSSVQLKVDPEVLWAELIPSQSIVFGAFYHSYHESIQKEFAAVERARLEFPEKLDEQRWNYLNTAPLIMSERPVWGGLLARRHHEVMCINAMEVWFANVLRYSRRDQLSLPAALHGIPAAKKNIVSEDLFESRFHKWPVSRRRKPAGYHCRRRDGPVAWCLRRILRHIENAARRW